MLDIQDVTADVTPQGEPDNGSGTSYEYSCETCGVEIFYAGRGRKPRYCDSHRKSAPKSTGSAPRRDSTDSLIESITQLYQGVGMALSFHPKTTTDGMMWTSQAEMMAESWRTLIDRDPKVRKMWVKLCQGSGYGAVIAAHAMVVYPIMQNHNLIPTPKAVSYDG